MRDILSYFSLSMPRKSLPDPFLILSIIASPIFVQPCPVVFTVFSSAIAHVFVVILNIGSLAPDDPFLVVFIPSFTMGLIR